MNPIPFLNPYQMAMIEREHFGTLAVYTKMVRHTDKLKIDEYLIEFSLPYFNTKSMPTLETIDDIYTQINILYMIAKDEKYLMGHLTHCLYAIAIQAAFPKGDRFALAYTHLVNECKESVIYDRDFMLADAEKCEIFIRNGWLAERVRKSECVSVRHGTRYDIDYKKDFSVYKDPVNDCVCP